MKDFLRIRDFISCNAKALLSILVCIIMIFGLAAAPASALDSGTQSGYKPTATLGVYQYVSGDYVYQADHNQNYAWHPDTIVIVKYTGNKRSITVPTQIDGYRVGRIGNNAFSKQNNPDMEELRSVVMLSESLRFRAAAISAESSSMKALKQSAATRSETVTILKILRFLPH